MTVAWLLGFQSPIVELVLAGIAVFLLSATYVGLQFEGVGDVAGRTAREDQESAEGVKSGQPQPGEGSDS